MSDFSAIEWTEATWNPTTGCTKVSEGCDHCYIERTPPFRMAHRAFDKPGVGGTTGVTLHPERLTLPLQWRKPRRVFVNSLSDLFHDDIPDEFIARVFTVMAQTPQHTYQVLTKRHARMRSLLNRWAPITGTPPWVHTGPWPLPNVWLGVSVENQQWADIRIPVLLQTPATVRWLSCEPLLGPVDPVWDFLAHIDWIVLGGESGPGARPMHPDWARILRDRCVAGGVPFFFKQWGEWAPTGLHGTGQREVIERIGKKRAGRELDGRTWDEYPPAGEP